MTTTTRNAGLRQWRTLGQVRAHHTGHWFDRDTMRFFNSRLPADSSPLIHGRYFISSEKRDGVYISSGYVPGSPRAFTIREVLSDGSIQTVGEFQGYSTRARAERAARGLTPDRSAYLADVLNRNGWIKRTSQLAHHCGAPLEDCRATIAARARDRRNARRRDAR